MVCIRDNRPWYCSAFTSGRSDSSILHKKKHLSNSFKQHFLTVLLFFNVLFISPCIDRDAHGVDKNREIHVVIFNSYHQGFKWTDDITAAVISRMSAKLEKIDFHVEYMDSKRHPGQQFNDILFKSFAHKYKRLKPDIIITSDDNALDFIQHHHEELFPEVPVVFCGVNDVSRALSVDRRYFTGLVETLDIAANIDLAQLLLPAISEIVIVSDGTSTGIGTRKMAVEVEADYPELEFTYLNGEEWSTDEMLAKLRQLRRTSAVIVPAWYLDKDGNTFDNTTIYPRITEASVVPVFGTSSANLGFGIIGGKLNSGTIQGEYAAHQALRILFGEVATEDLPVETASQNRFMFDHQQLVRFGISQRSLPPGASIVNRPVPFYELYKIETAVAGTSFLLLVVIIAFLIWNIRLRQKVQLDLINQKQMAERYLAVVGVILVAIDDQFRITLINRKGQEVLGYKEHELQGKDWFKICLPQSEYERVIKVYRELMAGKQVQYQYHENIIITKSGEERLVSWNNVLLKDSNGRITGILACGEDITDRKIIEQGLRESEERFRTLHNASFGGIVIHDKGLILDCNQGLSEITGYAFGELIGMDGLKLIAPDWRETVLQNIRAAVEHPYEVEGLRKDGTIYPLYLRGKNIPYKDRTARVVEFRDLTERKLVEQENIRLEAQLHQSQKMESIGQLAGGVAHDFNNMLSAILGHTEIAMIRSSPSDPVVSHLKGIQEAALRSADLVKQLLAFARKQTISPKVLDINDLSMTILKMLHRIIGEDIKLSWLPGKDLWKIHVDPSQLDQLLVNLCVNARDAITGGGRIIIETKNTIFNQQDCRLNSEFIPGEYVMLSVSDDGCGMSKKIQEQIFEPFFTTKELGLGTELGLATVYGIVKQNKGFINLYSEPEKGTTFRIYLPRYIGEE